MTTYSQTQLILLKQLGIIPLAAKSEFFASIANPCQAIETDTVTESAANNGSATSNLLMIHSADDSQVDVVESRYTNAQHSTVLVNDINIAMLQTTLRDWLVDGAASICSIEDHTLITPPIALLQQAERKRQLWQVLSEHYHD